MFPLGTVLFPHASLALHVFEPRYRALVTDCLHGDWQFGVVLIERGHEVGGGDQRFDVGTVATIVDAAQYPDGRWMIEAVGGRRIRVDEWLPDDPYPLALVDDLPDSPPVLPDGFERAELAVRRALALLAELDVAAPPTPRLVLDDDPDVAAWQLAAAAPLNPMDCQRLLEADDADARLALLADLAADAADLLAFRLGH